MYAAINRHADPLRTHPPGPRGVRRTEGAVPKFTDRFMSSLKVEPGRKDRLVFDTACPGLGVRVTAKGTRTFIAQWSDPATRRKVREPVGVWGNITIEQARVAVRARLGAVAKGVDPKAERMHRRAEAERERAEAAL